MGNSTLKLQDATDEQLMDMVNRLGPSIVSSAPLASDELTRRAMKRLEKAIEDFNKQSSEQTRRLIKLTWWIVALTIVMTIWGFIQIILAL